MSNFFAEHHRVSRLPSMFTIHIKHTPSYPRTRDTPFHSSLHSSTVERSAVDYHDIDCQVWLDDISSSKRSRRGSRFKIASAYQHGYENPGEGMSA
jgi:hypothetical protein